MRRSRMKRMMAAVLTLAMVFCLAVTPASAETVYQDSGGTEFAKLSKKEIASLLEENSLDLPQKLYEQEPSVTAPYQAGKVTAEALQVAADRLNAIRRIAGLPEVTLDLSLCEEAQYGAILLAASEFSHTPSKPADMDDAFYQKGLDATSSSNIAMGSNLAWSVDLFMYDSDSSNVAVVGHRRWQLNPTLGKVGFGVAQTTSQFFQIPYVTEKVFDNSGSGCDYDFIAWPSSGYFPVEDENTLEETAFFNPLNAWSVTVNTEKYGIPQLDSVTVKLTRESDGKVWNFSSDNSDINGNFFNVDNSGYGASGCIIFRPAGIEKYEGLYTVEISGLSGGTLAYQVNFFDVADANKPDPSRYFNDVYNNDWFFNAAEYVYENGIMAGTGASRFQPNTPLTRAMAVQLFYNLEGQPSLEGENLGYPFEDVDASLWYGDAVYWARLHQIVSGVGENSFAPNAPITREQFAQMLYGYAKYKGYDVTAKGDLSAFLDSGKISSWAQAALQWANGEGLINGDTNGYLSPGGSTTRAHAASILMKFDQNIVGG
ncbi:MAG: S-layer homology domain-containing protein [Acutalibacter sp.]|jgi:uncharacterized protein YkwD